MEVKDENLPKFGQTQRTLSAILTGACNPVGTSPENMGLVATAGPRGGMLTSLTFIALATVTASGVYLFIEKANTAVKRFKDAAVLPARTAASTDAAPLVGFRYSENATLRLEAGDKLYVGLGVAQASGVATNSEWTDF